jgi:molybdate transport system ATP-binding protein
MPSPFIIAQQVQVKHQQQVVLQELNFVINRGEHWLLTGDAGAGKSTLAKVLCGQAFFTGQLNIHFNNDTQQPHTWYVPQWHHFTNHAGINDFYYQQRYNSSDAEDARTVTEDIRADFPGAATAQIQALLQQFGIGHRADASLLLLSSGEQKKLQLTKAVLAAPQLLILDNPYIGLDIASRRQLNSILGTLSQQDTQLIIIGDAKEIPACITHVAVLEQAHLQVVPAAQFKAADYQLKNNFFFDIDLLGDTFTAAPANNNFDYAVQLNNVTISYGDKKVLEQVDWTIRKGDKWLLQGHNGAGKSTLLSLITGDNPQAYANDITLFDKRRGSGESIWDIKKKIGFVSPELHWYFDKNTTCREVILSGFFDTTGLYRAASEEQKHRADAWLHCLQLQSISNKLLAHVSIGQQQLLLLARAFVKNPPLLLLDEPFQGVDEQHAAQFIALIDAWMLQKDRTLIYISHRNDQIPACINQIFVLEQGRHYIKPNIPFTQTIA